MASPLTFDLSQVPTIDLENEWKQRPDRKSPRMRFVDCRYCGLPFGASRINSHQRICVKRPVQDYRLRFHACPHCGEMFSARVVRVHGPRCEKNPHVIARAEKASK